MDIYLGQTLGINLLLFYIILIKNYINILYNDKSKKK